MDELYQAGTDQIPALLLEGGTAISGDAGEIIAYLDGRCSERADAALHRERAQALAPGST